VSKVGLVTGELKMGRAGKKEAPRGGSIHMHYAKRLGNRGMENVGGVKMCPYIVHLHYAPVMQKLIMQMYPKIYRGVIMQNITLLYYRPIMQKLTSIKCDKRLTDRLKKIDKV